MNGATVPRHQTSAVLTIDLGALVANWQTLQAFVQPAECAAVVKANAYGLGVDRVVPALARAGCRSFFVAHLAEGVLVRGVLRAMGGGGRIFILNGLPPDDATLGDFLTFGLIPVIGSRPELQRWLVVAQASAFALHIDTGMNRLGAASLQGARELAEIIGVAGAGAEIALVMSHFVAAEQPAHRLNMRQQSDFAEISAIFPGVPASLANSSGIFLGHMTHYDVVRPGYALYGGNPQPGQASAMQPVVQLHASILQTRWIEAGETVGYGGRWTAQRRSHLATLGVGYADGFLRSAAHVDGKPGGAEVFFCGQRCAIVGNVSMDLAVIDVTDVPPGNVYLGDPVELFGKNISIDEAADNCGTIGYQLLTGLGQRFHRMFLNSELAQFSGPPADAK